MDTYGGAWATLSGEAWQAQGWDGAAPARAGAAARVTPPARAPLSAALPRTWPRARAGRTPSGAGDSADERRRSPPIRWAAGSPKTPAGGAAAASNSGRTVIFAKIAVLPLVANRNFLKYSKINQLTSITNTMILHFYNLFFYPIKFGEQLVFVLNLIRIRSIFLNFTE